MKLRIILGAPLPNPANGSQSNRYARNRKVKEHRQLVAGHLMAHRLQRPSLPVKVTLTRVSPRKLDGHDGPHHAFKSTVDEIAKWLGLTSDRDKRVEWAYQQRSDGPRVFALEIEIQPTETP